MIRSKSNVRGISSFRRSTLAFEPLEERRLLTLDAWTGLGDGVSWNDAANWSDGSPNSSSDVTINGPPTHPSITYSAVSGSTTVNSINGSDALTVTGGDLTVTGSSTLGGTLAITGGSLTASGSGVTFAANGATTVSNASLFASSGATLNLPNLASYTDSTGAETLEATGANSSLSLPALTALSTTGNHQINVYALLGGHVTFAVLASVTTGPVNFYSSGSGSQIDASALTTVHGTAGNGDSNIGVSGGGTFLHGSITTINRVDLNVDDSLGSLTFNDLTSITNGSLDASGGGSLNLPAVTSFSDSANFGTVEANGSGSTLSMPVLTTLSAGTAGINVDAGSDGHIIFAALTSVTTGPVVFASFGSGSQIDVSALTTLNGTPGNSNSKIDVGGGGAFLHGSIITIDRVDLEVNDSLSSLTFSALTSITNGNIFVIGGGSLNLSAVTSYSDSAISGTVEANGNGSTLAMPVLTTLSANSNEQITVEAFSGGHVTFAALMSVTTGPVEFVSSGSGSQIDVSALTTLSGTPGNNNSKIFVGGGGTFLHGSITTIDRVDLDLEDSLSSLPFSDLTSITNGNIVVNGGGNLNLSAVTSYTDSAGIENLQAVGSTLSMPVLTTLSTSGNKQINVEALSGGAVTFAALTSITTSPVSFLSSGSGSQIDISAITTFRGGTTISPSTIQLISGGILLDGNNPNTVINDVTVTTDSTFTLQSNQTFSSDNASTSVTGGTLVVQGALAALQYATLTISGNVTFNTQGIIADQVYGTIRVNGNVLGATQSPGAYSAQGTLTFNGSGTAGSPQQLEAMSADLGAVQSGFNNNFAYGILSLTGSTYVKLVDLSDNSPGAGSEAVYVKKLVVPVGTTLDLNGLHLYVRDASQVAGTIVNGSITAVTGSVVVNRQVFYSGSSRYEASIGNVPFSDDNAIAFDKSAYLPGSGAATFANVISYDKGVNGVIVDITGSHAGIVASDFIFKVGNNNSPASWVAAPAPASVTVRPLAGTGSDRVELIWASGDIKEKWLEVIVQVTPNTGLAANDVFFFGNAVANSGGGDTATLSETTSVDELGARNNGKTLLNNIPITNLFDYNRDGLVNSVDSLLSRNNAQTLGATRYINIGSGGPFAPPLPSGDSVATSVVTSDSAPTGGGDSGVASALVSSASPSQSLPPVPIWIVNRLSHVDLNSGPVAKYLEHLAVEDTAKSREILVKADQVADALNLDDELLDGLLVRLNLE